MTYLLDAFYLAKGNRVWKQSSMKKTALIVTVACALLKGGEALAQNSTNSYSTYLGNGQTLVTITAPDNSGGYNNYKVSTNQIVTVKSGHSSALFDIYFANGYQPQYTAGNLNLSTQPIEYTGATNVALQGGPGSITFTVSTPQTNSVSYVPANAVVIPSDATGNVQIILESSSDLVNWVPSLPGTYGSTYTNRFFRVRAVAQ